MQGIDGTLQLQGGPNFERFGRKTLPQLPRSLAVEW